MPQQIMIPNLGTVVVLSEDWTFKLYFESRNDKMIEAVGEVPYATSWRRYRLGDECAEEPKEGDKMFGKAKLYFEKEMSEDQLEEAYKSFRATNAQKAPYLLVTLPKGTQLSFDRIYIKRGSEAFNSVTFRTKKCPNKKLASKRFWVKLQDCNKIIADVLI